MLLYHVSTDLNFNSKFIPRIPKCMAHNENSTIPRICFSETLEGCFSAMPDGGIKIEQLIKNNEGKFRVYKLDLSKTLVNQSDILTPQNLWENDFVDDADLTLEYWILKPIEFQEKDSFIIQVLDWQEIIEDLVPHYIYKISEEQYGGDYLSAYKEETQHGVPAIILIEDLEYTILK